MSESVLLVMQNPKAGQGDRHRDWYLTHHLPDMCGVPGVERGEFVAVADPQAAPEWSNAALYWLNGDALAITGEVFKRARSGAWEMSDTLDPNSLLMTLAEPLTDRVRSRAAPDATGDQRLLYIVLTNATDGNDEAFNAWYSGVHIADVLAVPGFVAAQRFRLTPIPGLAPSPYAYLALYEVEKSAADEAFAGLSARAGTAQMVLSPALDTKDVHAVAFRVEGVRTA